MILIDTGPLVALCDPRDQHHQMARSQWQHLYHESVTLATPILCETVYHLPLQNLRQRLRRIIEQYEMQPAIVEENDGFRQRVFDWLDRYAEHEPDYADGCLAVLSGMDHRRRVWAFDHEFETIWRRPDGSKIPLVNPRK